MGAVLRPQISACIRGCPGTEHAPFGLKCSGRRDGIKLVSPKLNAAERSPIAADAHRTLAYVEGFSGKQTPRAHPQCIAARCEYPEKRPLRIPVATHRRLRENMNAERRDKESTRILGPPSER
ncbi:MAG: hypothetical protein JWO52_3071 [Gammaproteobacteria bacterium]|nr:hypothetical protein [Gammaproteobacteria bacterium]